MTSNIYQNTDNDKILTENQSKNSVLLQGNKPVVVPYQKPAISDNDKNIRIKIKEPNKSEPPDNIYYNMDILNREEDQRPIPAVYDVERSSFILEDPSLYSVTVSRFEVPSSIPLLIFPEPTDYQFFLSLEDRTNPLVPIVSKFPVVFVDYVLSPFLPAYPRGVFYVRHFLKMVNTTLETCYNNMKVINPGYLPTQAPFFTYESTSTIITMWADGEYLDYERYTINMSTVLYTVGFTSLLSRAIFEDNVPSQGRTPIQILVEDEYVNSETVKGTLLYKNIGEYSTLPLFNQLQSILIESDSMNIEGEIQSGVLSNVKRLLTDFQPADDVSNRQFYTYNPTIYRWYNLLSTTPMNRLSCRVFITYSTGETYPLLILFNELVSIKLLFKLRKNL